MGDVPKTMVFFGWRLCLDIANDTLLTIPNSKVWVAGFGLLGKGCDMGLFLAGRLCAVFNEFFQAGVVAFFSGVPVLGDVEDSFKVGAEHPKCIQDVSSPRWTPQPW